MNPRALQTIERTEAFFDRVTILCERLPRNSTTIMIAQQLTDSAGGTKSNYRAACRARTKKEFVAKIGVAAEEADESHGWLRDLLRRGYGERKEVESLVQEADELTAMFTASHKTGQRRQREREERDRQENELKRARRAAR
jgi:four helix bundle protein